MCRTLRFGWAEEVEKVGGAEGLGCFDERENHIPWKEGREIIRKGCFRVVCLKSEYIVTLKIRFQCFNSVLVQKRLSHCVKLYPLRQVPLLGT